MHALLWCDCVDLIKFLLLISSPDCTYLYIEQPPTGIDCNPYVDLFEGEVLSFQCALTAPTGTSVTINWYHDDSAQSDGVSEHPIETSNDTDTHQSVLSLTDPQPEQDSGDYYCRAAVDGRDLMPSEPFTLCSDEFAYINLGECISMETFSRSATKCADVPPTTEPVATPTTPPPQPTTSQTTLPTTVTPSQTTSQPTLGGTTPTDPLIDPDAIATDDGTLSSSDPSGVPKNLQVWIYVLVGVAAVFLMIIIIMTIMCVGLCLRRNKTHDSQTLKRESVCVYVWRGGEVCK